MKLEDYRHDQLKKHNYYRRGHGASGLVIDEKINNHAQEWAEYLASKGSFYHRPNNQYGENLASASALTSDMDASKMWYDEISMYNFGSQGFSSGTGHFTQLVWKGSKRVGFGLARGRNGMWVTCANYYPAGNMQGDFSRNVQRPNFSNVSWDDEEKAKQEKLKNEQNQEKAEKAEKEKRKNEEEKAEIQQWLIKFAVCENLPFISLQTGFYAELIKKSFGNFQPPTPTDIVENLIPNALKELFDDIDFNQGPLSITTDSAQVYDVTLQMMTCHGRDKNFDPVFLVLAAIPFSETEKNDDQIAKLFIRTIKKFNINESNIAFIIGDRSENGEGDKDKRVLCLSSLLSQNIDKAIFENGNVKELAKKCQIALTEYYETPEGVERKLTLSQGGTRVLADDDKTRWTTTYYAMLDAVLLEDHVKKIVKFSDDEWKFLDEIVKLLGLFEEEINNALQPDACISSYIPVLTILMKALENQDEGPKAFMEIIDALKSGLKNSSTEIFKNPRIQCATLLDPRFKYLPVLFEENEWQKVEENLIEYAGDLNHLFKAKKMEEKKEETPKTKKSNLWDSLSSSTTTTKKHSSAHPENEEKIRAALQYYKKLPNIDVKTGSPWQFWQANKKDEKMKILKYLAKYFLSAPPSAVPAERIFSPQGVLYAKHLKENYSSAKAEEILLFKALCHLHESMNDQESAESSGDDVENDGNDEDDKDEDNEDENGEDEEDEED